jgi:hydrogenase maturation protease
VNNNKPVTPTLIIGVGNEFRCDDAAGIIAAKKLKDLLSDDIAVFESDGDGAKIMDVWNGHSNVILIDAVSFGTSPGTVHIINANEKEFPKETAIHSSHMFSVAEAIETSRVLNKLPESIIIYGIEGKSYELGKNVSDEVKQSVDKVVSEIQKEITN